MKTINLTKGMVLGVVTLLISSLLLGVLMQQPAKADYDGGPVRTGHYLDGSLNPSGGFFLVNGSGVRPDSIGICSDPALPAPEGSEFKDRDLPTYSIREYIMAHPRLSTLPEGQIKGNDSRKNREGELGMLMYSISPDIDPRHDSIFWDDLWAKFQAAGLEQKYHVGRTGLAKSVVHFLLGAISNYSYSDGIKKFPADVQNFFKTHVFSNAYSTNNTRWIGTSFWRVVGELSREEIQEIANTIRVINIHDQGAQAIFFHADPINMKVKLNLTKVSQIPAFTDNNPAYNLNGAVYGVFSNEAATQKVGELRVGANGQSNTLELKKGVYYVKEITSPPSYELDPTVYSVNLNN